MCPSTPLSLSASLALSSEWLYSSMWLMSKSSASAACSSSASLLLLLLPLLLLLLHAMYFAGAGLVHLYSCWRGTLKLAKHIPHWRPAAICSQS
jgi:hypothetical protein